LNELKSKNQYVQYVDVPSKYMAMSENVQDRNLVVHLVDYLNNRKAKKIIKNLFRTKIHSTDFLPK
jgi:hypothetical protein